MARLPIGGLLFAMLVVAQAPSQGAAVASRLDDGLDRPGMMPVFVRMQDQLFARAGDYEAFCRKHARTARSELRSEVLARLRTSSDRSYAAVRATVERLIENGGIADLQRFWIVNGFAADATRAACEALAALPEVSFVYLQRQPGRWTQHHATARSDRWKAGRRADLERALKMVPDAEAPFDPEGLRVPWNVRRIGADVAWRTGAHGQGVVIALNDSGLIVEPPLARALWRNRGETLNGEDDDGNGFVDDLFGWDFRGDTPYAVGDPGRSHGSLCGGILAGRPWGEPSTVTGIAPRARLMVLRGMGQLRAFEYAAANGADVFSMSFMWVNVELGNYRGVFRAALEHLAACGVVAVGGAGNFRQSAPAGKQITLPKDIPCVIAAAGIVEDDTQAPPSSEGPCTWDDVVFYGDYPKHAPLAKPDVTGVFGVFPTWHWASFRGKRPPADWVDEKGEFGLIRAPKGNSFSGPHAGGVAALMLSVRPELTPWRVKELIEATCEDLGPEGRDYKFGAGLVRADAAVEAARKAVIGASAGK